MQHNQKSTNPTTEQESEVAADAHKTASEATPSVERGTKTSPRGIVARLWHRFKPTRPVLYLAIVAMAGLLTFSLIRLVLFMRNEELLSIGIDTSDTLLFDAMLVGVRYDVVVSFYILLIPLLLLIIADFLSPKPRKVLSKVAVGWIAVCYLPIIVCGIGDIPFYEHFDTHVNAVAISYLLNDMGQATSMIFHDVGYLTFALISFIVGILFVALCIRVARRMELHRGSERKYISLLLTILWIGASPLIIRGMHLQPRPMSARDAAISENKFANELSKSPVFVLAKSVGTLWSSVNLMNPNKACRYVREELGRDNTLSLISPAKETPWEHVVIVVQESSTVARLAREGNDEGLTPCLDSLIRGGRYYQNVYSTGTHTCHGLYSTITSLPSYININPLTDGLGSQLNTIYSQIAEREDVRTMFFVTHDPNFDNVYGFTTTEGFELFWGENQYTAPTQHKTWGVDDHVMFDHALESIDSQIASGQRVVAMILTCSNHEPYNAPLDVGFTPTATDEESIAVQYADWSLGRFMDMAHEREWFDKTLFVITGDHGKAITSDYFIPDSFVHIPLLMYSPAHIDAEVRDDLMSQMDTTPTVMAMLGYEYTNRSLGIDVNSTSRRMIPYGADGCIAARDRRWVYIYAANDNMRYLYDLEADSNERLRNVAAQHPAVVDSMHLYIASMTQTGWEIHNNPNRTTF